MPDLVATPPWASGPCVGSKAVCLSGFDPRQASSGGTVYTNSILSLLEAAAPGLAVELCCLSSNEQIASSFGRRAFKAICLARSYFSSLPAKSHFVRSRSFEVRVRQLFKASNYDMALINADDALWLLPLIPDGTTKVLICHNLEYLLFESMIDRRRPNAGIIPTILQRELRKLKSFEISSIKKIGNIVAISEHEADVIRSFHPGANILHVPPTFSYKTSGFENRTPSVSDLKIGFLGKLTWWPNVEGVTWFIEDVFPHLDPRISLHLFGQGSEAFADSERRIAAHGFVDRTPAIFSSCDLMICPIFSGAGVNVKLAESLYNGVPVITTSHGLRGLNLPSDPCLLTCDTADRWIESLNALTGERTELPAVSETVRHRFAEPTYLPAMIEFLTRLK